MRVKSIIIELQPGDGDEAGLATLMQFYDGKWVINGLLYSRYHEMLHRVWCLVRDVSKS